MRQDYCAMISAVCITQPETLEAWGQMAFWLTTQRESITLIRRTIDVPLLSAGRRGATSKGPSSDIEMHTGVGEASQCLNPGDGKATSHPERVWLGTDNGPEDVNSLPGLQISSVADNIPPPMPQGATRYEDHGQRVSDTRGLHGTPAYSYSGRG